jgi:MYXO-CTERM domain-containing protein
LPAGSTASTQQTGTQTFQITIPASAVCTSAQPCTLQVIMVMTDHPASDCYYHHCADISTGSAPDAGGDSPSADAPVVRDASNTLADASGAGGSGNLGGATGRGGSSGSGGVTAAGGSVSAGGDTGRGGSAASGGVTGLGGSVSAGGDNRTGSTASGGGTVAGGAGGATSTGTGTGGPANSGSGCSCDLSSRGGAPWGMAVVGLGAMVALRGRRRRR